MEKRIVQIVVIALLVIGCLLVLRPFVTALLSAAIVCYSTWPVYKLMERAMGGRRTLAAFAMTLLLIFVVILPVALLASTVADSVRPVVDWVHDVLDHGLPLPPDWVKDIPLVGSALDTSWREIALSKDKLVEMVKRFTQPAQQAAIGSGLLLGQGVLQLSLATFIGFFFYRDGEVLMAAVRSAMNRIAGELAPSLLMTVGGTIQGVVYGIIGTAIAQGLVALLGFLIAGVPGALLLAFLIFVLSMAPFGPPLVWGGAAAWLLYQNEIGWAIFMAVWGMVAISGIDNVIKPLIISRGSSLPFLLVLLGVFGGVVTFGFVGIFIGPTLMAVAYTLVREWTRPPTTVVVGDQSRVKV